MRFIVRAGTDPAASADGVLLRTLGLPYGGVVAVGDTHLLVSPATMKEPTAIAVGPLGRANAGVTEGDSIDVSRAVLAPASLVRIDAEGPDPDPATLAAAWQGRPVTAGDTVEFDDGRQASILAVEPEKAGLVGPATRVAFGVSQNGSDTARGEGPRPAAADAGSATESPLTSDQAVLAGLETQRELLSGWLTLLTSPADLPATWALPRVAGVWVEGPAGCGRPELVAAAATDVGILVETVSLERVFKPERLLEVLQGALARAENGAVVFIDRLELVCGTDAIDTYRTQFGAVFRWFLDTVAERPGLAVVLGTSGLGAIEPALRSNPLLPRSLSIPPPDVERRKLLFTAALAGVPTDSIDHELLAARSAGFSGTDIVGTVLAASARLAHRGGVLTSADLLEAIHDATPSLGSASMGDIPSHGFAQVANLAEVKQRLQEAVIWPVTEPERFAALGINPPRGVLLHGPPGTGKTFVVGAVAHEAGAAFFPVKGAELLDKYVGESERGVRDVFARARMAAPSIIFFDELDALAPVRGRSTTSVTDSVVAALLTELDGVSERGTVAVIGATNRPDLVDPALLRSGRFETHIELGLPDIEARRALLAITDVPFADDVDPNELAKLTDGLSFADMTGMLREAALTALRRDTAARLVEWADLEAARGRFVGERTS